MWACNNVYRALYLQECMSWCIIKTVSIESNKNRTVRRCLAPLWWYHRAELRLVPSQWETSLQSNAVSHWMGANLVSALYHVLCHRPIYECYWDSKVTSIFKPKEAPWDLVNNRTEFHRDQIRSISARYYVIIEPCDIANYYIMIHHVINGLSTGCCPTHPESHLREISIRIQVTRKRPTFCKYHFQMHFMENSLHRNAIRISSQRASYVPISSGW